MKILLCGNAEQYENYLREHNLKPEDIRYIKDAYSLCGLHEPDLYVTGTWYNRKDITEIIDQLQNIWP